MLKPLGDRVIIERVEEEEKTASGIIVPESAKEKPQQGRVVAVGKGRVADNGSVIVLDVKENDKVVFQKYAGTELKHEGKDYLILREDDILAIIG
ncbi:10 kDa chaperonin [Halolactibacillus miurensis]|uniref:Co-chaperonin GroES n=1 Tax=Halolactibacillus miurensis TaxID=306541 RepID=A0A1I6TVL6_9BACI|nr:MULTISPECIES: co-chaperone GroES [Halolactibacillus]GEM05442.1 10 kDa chaperonin [Halolactibacillus miurensis]SFS93226.1 chaperonin GroES [Halolactibacillus miurensis]